MWECRKCETGAVWRDDSKPFEPPTSTATCENDRCSTRYRVEEDWSFEGDSWVDGSDLGEEIE